MQFYRAQSTFLTQCKKKCISLCGLHIYVHIKLRGTPGEATVAVQCLEAHIYIYMYVKT